LKLEGWVASLARYRRRFDILADMMRVAGSGARKTKIMYFANLSFVLLNRYLEDALHVGFLRFDGEEYLVTKKGEAYLERYNKFSSMCSSVREDLSELKSEAEVLDRMCRSRRDGNKNGRRSRLAVLG
jgi:predicted transcriptional regulator